jgi:cytochrome bd-type quinol oxidase subunit 2
MADQDENVRPHAWPLAILAAMAMVHASDMRAMIDEFAANSLWPWVLGAFNLLGGLIIIAPHQYRRSAAAIIVSVLGRLLALRGLFILAFPQTSVSIAKNAIGAATLTLSRTGVVVLALVGLYLDRPWRRISRTGIGVLSVRWRFFG